MGKGAHASKGGGGGGHLEDSHVGIDGILILPRGSLLENFVHSVRS